MVSANNAKRRICRVLIVDAIRSCAKVCAASWKIEEDLVVCGEAETAGEACIAIKELHPDVMTCPRPVESGVDLGCFTRASVS